jgi:ABC-type multidrug transport system fused ATPase/permease subunit
MNTVKKPGVISRIFALLRTHRREVTVLFALIIFATLCDITVPFISQRLIDTLTRFLKTGGPPPIMYLAIASLFILVVTVISRTSRTSYDFRLFKLVTSTEDEAHHLAFEKYLSLHALFHHSASSGQIIGRIDRGVQAIYTILNDIFGQNLLPPLITFVGVLIALLTKNVFIALAVFIPLPVYVVATRELTSRIYDIEKAANDQFEQVAKESYDVAGNVLTVKKFSQESAEAALQRKLQFKARTTQYDAERLWGFMEMIQTFIATVGRIAVIVIAGYLVFKGKSTIGEFVLYITLQNMAYGPLGQLSVVLPRLRRNTARAERLFDIIDEPIHVADVPNAAVLPRLEKEIRFNKVGFQYVKRRWALKDVSIAIPAKSTVALVGRSGSGKTTFINLLLRSYDPQRGFISIDGIDIREVTQRSLRGQIAVVPQEIDLFSRTIAENISYGRRGASRQEIIKAAKMALAHEFIMRMEYNYDTVVGERGVKLSGGERQRVGIARAILRDPSILVFDEATSHLDTESERLIQKAMEKISRNRTTIIIAHRLSTVLAADAIMVFNNGVLEAVGPHKEILATSPTYKRLYNLQFQEEE